MKSWKDQLRDLKKELQGSGRTKEGRNQKPKIDFEPPPAWMAGGESTPKRSPTGNPVPKPNRTVAEVMAPAIKPTPRQSATRPPLFKPRIDRGCALNMPKWGDIGKSLQHPEFQGGRSKPMPVRIGIDFGTAFTKVVVRAGVDLVPIEWSAVTRDDSDMGRYLVPNFVQRAPDGEFCWRRLAKADIQGNLKLPIFEMAETDDCPIATVAYLALVIRYARAFLYRNAEIGRKLKERSLLWELNIGCPTEPHEKREVVELFRKIAQVAWYLSGKNELSDSSILEAWKSYKSDATDIGLETKPGVVPEFAAQLSSYLESNAVGEGLHLLVDVGAGTLDVAPFCVVRRLDQDGWNLSPYFPAVRQLGTHFLNERRYKEFEVGNSWDDGAPPASVRDFARRYGLEEDRVRKIDEAFKEGVVDCIFHSLNTTRINARGLGPEHSAWGQVLPVFLTGGGSLFSLYQEAIEEVERRLKGVIRESRGNVADGFRFVVGTPQYRSKNDVIGLRLSVAMGLAAKSEDDVDRIMPFRDRRPFYRRHRERPNHEELYGD